MNIGRKVAESALVALVGGVGLVALVELAGYGKQYMQKNMQKPQQALVHRQPTLPTDNINSPTTSPSSDSEEKKKDKESEQRVTESFDYVAKTYFVTSNVSLASDVSTFFRTNRMYNNEMSVDTLGGFLIAHYVSTGEDYAIRTSPETL